jgi:hypothetical protein
MLVVIAKLKLADDSTMAKIKGDVKTLFDDLKARVQTETGITINADINQDYL